MSICLCHTRTTLCSIALYWGKMTLQPNPNSGTRAGLPLTDCSTFQSLQKGLVCYVCVYSSSFDIHGLLPPPHPSPSHSDPGLSWSLAPSSQQALILRSFTVKCHFKTPLPPYNITVYEYRKSFISNWLRHTSTFIALFSPFMSGPFLPLWHVASQKDSYMEIDFSHDVWRTAALFATSVQCPVKSGV